MIAPTTNRLLASLSNEDRNLLLQRAVTDYLPRGFVVEKAVGALPYAYFLTSGLASVITRASGSESAEVSVIGREGVIGIVRLLGPASFPSETVIDVPGIALRIPLKDLERAFYQSKSIQKRILEFVQQDILTQRQITACQLLHPIKQRLARMLLMLEDRMQSEVIELTQGALASMLGAGRPTVTLTAGFLQRSGGIDYERGKVHVIDRERLVDLSCNCYAIIRQLYAGLYQHDLNFLKIPNYL